MPLLDHFRPPLSRTHPWRAFHGAWAAAMARRLNDGVLPSGYYAVPFLDREGPVEVDVAALQDPWRTDAADDDDAASGWVPEAPELAVAVEWPTADEVRVEIFADEGDPRLAAAVELVSPSNKDRPQARAAFASKCADYLRRGCGLVVIDVVTTRRGALHADLLTALGVELEARQATPSDLSAVSYRPIGGDGSGRLLVWPAALEVGRALPTLPLWLRADLAVPLDLEASHSAACEDLRIRQAS